MKYKSLMTPEMEEYFDTINPGNVADDVARLMNEKFGTSFTRAQIAGYRKNHHKPCGVHLMWGHGLPIPDNAGKRYSPATEFKTGGLPHNTWPIGTVVERDGYLWKKVDDKPGHGVASRFNWRQLHRIVWEEANGPIPKGHVLIFKDGDRHHIELDNLILVTNGELQYINRKRMLDAGPEYAETAKLTARLYRETKKKTGGK